MLLGSNYPRIRQWRHLRVRITMLSVGRLRKSREIFFWKEEGNILHPTGESANFKTVSWMMSSGSESIKAERIYHWLPAIPKSQRGTILLINELILTKKKDRSAAKQTFSSQYLSHAILLMQKAFFIHLVKETLLAFPRRYSRQEFLALLPSADVTHLYDDEGVLTCGTCGEDDVRVEFARGSFYAVTEMFDE